jgi:hypothetical protein
VAGVSQWRVQALALVFLFSDARNLKQILVVFRVSAFFNFLIDFHRGGAEDEGGQELLAVFL